MRTISQPTTPPFAYLLARSAGQVTCFKDRI